MLQNVESIVFRKLTTNDYVNIYRPKQDGDKGGYQKFIDFSSTITRENWRDFFRNYDEKSVTNGPAWDFELKSLGIFQGIQIQRISQRRPTTFNITEQNLSENQTRVFAWTPDLTGFPEPDDPNNITTVPDSLYVYIVRLQNGEHWAGWFQTDQPKEDWYVNTKLKSIFSKNDGYFVFDDGPVAFDVSKQLWPFTKL